MGCVYYLLINLSMKIIPNLGAVCKELHNGDSVRIASGYDTL